MTDDRRSETEAPGGAGGTARPAAGERPAAAIRGPLAAASRWRRALPAAPAWAARLTRPRPPSVAVLFGRDRFILAEVRPGPKGGRPVLAHAAVHALPEGSLRPSLLAPNIAAPADVAARLGRALEALPGRKGLHGLGLVLPDCCARVTVLTLKDLPPSRRQAREMIRWQMRKRVPFHLDEARLAFQRFPLPDGEERVVVMLALEVVLAPYEQVIQALGLQPGLIDLVTFNLANLARAASPDGGEEGDLALIHAGEEDLSLLVLRAGVPLFYRSKDLLHGPSREPEAARREMNRELLTSLAYYRDRLAEDGRPPGRVILSGSPAAGLAEVVREQLGIAPGPLDIAAAVAPRPGLGDAGAGLLQAAGPIVGLIVGRSAA